MNTKYTMYCVEFKGQKTLNEIYRVHLNELQDSVKALRGDKIALALARLEVKNILATVENELILANGGKLRSASDYIRGFKHD